MMMKACLAWGFPLLLLAWGGWSLILFVLSKTGVL